MAYLIGLLLAAPADGLSEFSAETQRTALVATVRLSAAEPDRVGSGVVIGRRDGFAYVLTAKHVVSRSRRYVVETFATGSRAKPAAAFEKVELLWEESDCDVALMRFPTDGKDVPTRPVAQRGSRPPFSALGVGGDLGAAPTCRVERVEARKLVRDRTGTSAFFWKTGESPEAGRSGGPLFDRSGRVIGVCSGGQDGAGYYAHLDEIRAALRKHDAVWLLADEPAP